MLEQFPITARSLLSSSVFNSLLHHLTASYRVCNRSFRIIVPPHYKPISEEQAADLSNLQHPHLPRPTEKTILKFIPRVHLLHLHPPLPQSISGTCAPHTCRMHIITRTREPGSAFIYLRMPLFSSRSDIRRADGNRDAGALLRGPADLRGRRRQRARDPGAPAAAGQAERRAASAARCDVLTDCRPASAGQ